MAKLKTTARFVPRARLTAEEFESLKVVGERTMKPTIPDAHRARLIKAGYIRAVVVDRSTGSSALTLTGAGRQRLESGK